MKVAAAATNDPKTRVINVRQRKHTEDEVYIGRGGPWGNPYRIGRDGTRTDVIDKFRVWIRGDSRIARMRRARIAELKGKTLVCFCKPQPCHGDILAEMADAS